MPVGVFPVKLLKLKIITTGINKILMLKIIMSTIPFITLYAAASTFIMIILIIKLRKRNKKYIHWKREKISFFKLWEYETERNDDWLLTELFSENQRLENVVKVLKKDNTNLSIMFLVFLVITLIGAKVSKPFKAKSNTKSK